MEWGTLTPFSPAELRQTMRKQQLEPRLEYSWLPANPKKVRVRRRKPDAYQMRLDFGINEPDSGARTDWLSARARSFRASGPCDLSATVAATTCADQVV